MADTDDVTKPGAPTTTNWADTIRDTIKNAAPAADEIIEEDDDEEEIVQKTGGDTEGDDGDEVVNKGEDEEDEEDLDDKAGDDKKTESKIRFTQFKGDGTPEAYTKNLETGYEQSSAEAIRLKEVAETATNDADNYKSQVEAIKTAVAADPEFGTKVIALLDAANTAEKTNGTTNETPSDSPFLTDAETKWRQENDESAAKFAESNPEVLSDPILADKVKKLMKRFGEDIFKEEKRLAKSGELMEKAYGYLGLTDKKQKKQELTDAMKGAAAPTRKQAPKKKAVSTAQFSDLSLKMAGKMGITKERLEKNGV